MQTPKSEFRPGPTKLLAVLFCLLTSALCPQAFSQGTAFTYQGLLTDQGAPANGTNDLTFTLFPASSGGLAIGTSNVVDNLVTSNGLFTVTLDFGSSPFSGSDRWLQIAARPGASTGPYTNLSPRQKITPAPYAIFASGASNATTFSGLLPSTGLSGTYGSPLTFSNAANNIRGTFTGNGANVSNVNAVALNGLTASAFWQLDGNNVTPSDVLGSTNNQALQLVVNGFNALRLEPNSMASPNIVGGNGNGISAGVYAAVIGGGFANNIDTNADQSIIAGGAFNHLWPGAFCSAILGGGNNSISTNAAFCFVSGGSFNQIEPNCQYSSIGGGQQNDIRTSYATIAGGYQNANVLNTQYSFIGGGRNNTNNAGTCVLVGGEANTIQALADRAFIGGGLQNVVSGANGVVLGGFANNAGSQSFAAGRRAKATDSGSFVWGDSTDADVTSGGANSVTFRAVGGYRLFSSSDTTPPSPGVSLVAGASAWGTISDRNAKKNFAVVDEREVLEKLAAIPVQHWNYRWETDDAVPNLGPTAQDFKGAFYPGRDDKTISTLEFDGVELAAIQGLNQKLNSMNTTLREELKQKETEIAELKHRLEALEKIVRDQNSD
jgi:Chaperone of endosialidase